MIVHFGDFQFLFRLEEVKEAKKRRIEILFFIQKNIFLYRKNMIMK